MAEIELLAAYVSPENVRRIVEMREATTPVSSVQGQRVKFGDFEFELRNPEYNERINQLRTTGTVTQKENNPDIPRVRREVEKRTGKPLPSIRRKLKESGVDIDSVVPDGSEGEDD